MFRVSLLLRWLNTVSKVVDGNHSMECYSRQNESIKLRVDMISIVAMATRVIEKNPKI